MKRSFILSAVLIAVVGLFISPYCFAATYRYVDKNGQVGLADDLQMIPEPYRATAVLISGEAKEGEGTPGPAAAPAQAAGAGAQQAAVPAAPVGQAPAAAQAQPPSPPEKGMPFSIRLAISIGVVIATILVSVFLGKVGALHGHDRAIHILRVSLSWLVVIYLVAAHAKDVLTIFEMAGKHVQAISDESAKKGEKAAQAIKALDAMMEQAAQQAREHDKAMKEAEQAAEK